MFNWIEFDATGSNKGFYPVTLTYQKKNNNKKMGVLR